MKRIVSALGCLVLVCALCPVLRAQSPGNSWLDQWKQKNRQWRALLLYKPQAEKVEITKRFIADVLAPKGINVLILEVDYAFQYMSRPELRCQGITKEQARDLAAFCRRHNVRLIPAFTCLSHQSGSALLSKYPEFAEPPRGYEWCPSHREVNRVVFGLIDELIDAFQADAIHVGMDEVFSIGNEKCGRCRGKDVAELFAKVVNELHEHLVGQKGVEMLMWGDRLLDASAFPYGKFDSSQTGSHRAINLIPKDIIVCDWHYHLKDAYPSIQFFQEKGFRVLPTTWNRPEAAVALIRASRQNSTDKMLGILFTAWRLGGNEDLLMAALQAEGDDQSERPQIARQVADTITAGLQELNAAME